MVVAFQRWLARIVIVGLLSTTLPLLAAGNASAGSCTEHSLESGSCTFSCWGQDGMPPPTTDDWVTGYGFGTVVLKCDGVEVVRCKAFFFCSRKGVHIGLKVGTCQILSDFVVGVCTSEGGFGKAGNIAELPWPTVEVFDDDPVPMASWPVIAAMALALMAFGVRHRTRRWARPGIHV